MPLFLSGVTMGGGWGKGAVRRHLKQGLKVFATPEAARTFDDDLEEVKRWGVELVSAEEAPRQEGLVRLETRDVDLPAIKRALEALGATPHFDAVAVAVQDHGAAPPGVSDRVFRFQHLRHRVEQGGDLVSFAYSREEIPEYLTRMKGVAQSVPQEFPLVVMDTGPAAVLGAGEDPVVEQHQHRVLINVGNMHTIAFRLRQSHILGVVEHHTAQLDAEKLDSLLTRFIRGNLTHEEVFHDGGHGCFILSGSADPSLVAVTGPQRGRMRKSSLQPYFAAPYGDMMLAGCFGLARAFSLRIVRWREEIEQALSRSR
jgi:uncharacterized protein (DUF1786 family)